MTSEKFSSLSACLWRSVSRWGASPRCQRGFTLTELMMTLAVLAVLVGIGVPSFREVALSSRLSSYANDFVASANLARGEAIKRNSRVGMCASSDGATCASSGGWEQGWVVFHDADNDDVLDTGETLLERREPLADGFSMRATGNVRYLRFEPTGIDATAATLTICKKTPAVGSQERVVALTLTGRLSVSKTTAGSC